MASGFSLNIANIAVGMLRGCGGEMVCGTTQLQRLDELLHLCLVLTSLEEEVPLVAGTCEVVLRIRALPVVIAVEIVPEEAYCLHVREQFGSVRQQ